MKISKILTYGFLLTASLSVGEMQGQQLQVPGAIEGPKINVLLAKGITSALLEAKGSYQVIRKDTKKVLSSGTSGKRFMVHALQDGLRWGEEYPDVYQIEVVAQNPSTVFYLNGIQYQGSISIYHMPNNNISIINELPIENYVKSVLTLDYDKPLFDEAMAALAIAKRTEVYAHVMRTNNRPWDIVAEEAGYFGFSVTHRHNGVEEAVDRTRFMILELTKEMMAAQTIDLTPQQAEKLAKEGLDARLILKNVFPDTKMGITVNPNKLSIL